MELRSILCNILLNVCGCLLHFRAAHGGRHKDEVAVEQESNTKVSEVQEIEKNNGVSDTVRSLLNEAKTVKSRQKDQ